VKGPSVWKSQFGGAGLRSEETCATMSKVLENRESTGWARWGVVGLLFVAVLINFVDRGNLSVAAVPLMKELELSPEAMGVLLSVFFWTYALLQVPAGYVVDRFGFKSVYAIAFVVWSLASAAIGVTSSFSQIIGLRLLLGAAESVAHPLSLTYIKKAFQESERGLPTGLYVSGMMVGAGSGSLLGGLFLKYFGWRQLFIITGLGGTCIWLLPWLILAPSAPARPTPTPAQRSTPIAWATIIKSPLLWGITIGIFGYSYYWYFFLTWVPAYLVMAHHFSFVKMGVYSASALGGMAIMSPVGGWLADRLIARLQRPLLIRKAFVGIGCFLASSVLLLLKINSAPLVLATLMFSLAGLGLASSNFWSLTQAISPGRVVGRIVGYQNSVGNLAGICAPLITGLLLGGSKNFQSSISLAGLSLWIAAAAVLFLFRAIDVETIQACFPEGQQPILVTTR
jgi:ACS family D-galactonate transporter-like MFS transporter